MRTATISDIALPDGTICHVEDDGLMALISRQIDGETVWGQVFSACAEDHPAQVERVVASMQADPAAFITWQRADALPPPIFAQRGRQIGSWDGNRFTPFPPLMACLILAARAAQARADLAGVTIVGYWNMPVGASA
jgi:hypothetical protein